MTKQGNKSEIRMRENFKTRISKSETNSNVQMTKTPEDKQFELEGRVCQYQLSANFAAAPG